MLRRAAASFAVAGAGARESAVKASRVRRAFSSGAPSTGPRATAASSGAHAGGVEPLAATTPGITRLRKSGGRVVEVDSTIARIMGSDWGDRRNQSVTLPMRLYWIIFGLVLVNGVYTYVAGKDEMYLVDKVQKKVDEKLGVVETNEFVVMADEQQPAAKTGPSAEKSAPAATTIAEPESAVAAAAPRALVFASTAGASATPFFHPSAPAPAARPKSKADLQTQLLQLRVKQQQLQRELESGASFRDVDDVEVEIRLVDQQKAQLKRMIKRL
ncbi:hypothetical protein PybrP1_005533 [[Pythium] brassicae (nom. inval.)]|nr:hypothetical protein PybrP1_005533 [[Pythium] brassicae (nom. inval.)]